MPHIVHNKIKLSLLIIIIAGIIIRIITFNGFGAVDDAEYARFAHAISIGQFPITNYQGPAVFPLRLGIILPTALLFKIFGVHEWTMVGFPFLVSILGIWVAYLGARMFFGDIAGLICAIIWAVLPIDSFHASLLIPDPAGALFAGSAILMLVSLFKDSEKKQTKLYTISYFAGLMLGYSWLCKTSLVYLFPFMVILCIFTLYQNMKRNLTIWIIASGGLATILISEMLFYHFAAEDLLFRIHAVQQNISGNPAAFDMDAVGNLKAILKRILLSGPLTMLTTEQFLLLPLIGLLGGAHAAYWKDKSFAIPLLWLIALMAVYNFGSISFKHYIPLLIFERYLYPLFLPAAIITAGFLAKLWSSSNLKISIEEKQIGHERQFWAGIIIAILIVTAAYRNYKNTTWYPTWTQAVRAVSKIVRPDKRVYTDILSIHGLAFFWNYPEKKNTYEFKSINTVSDIDPGSYILVNEQYLDWLKRKAGWWPNLDGRSDDVVFSDELPENWKLIWQGDASRLYHVALKEENQLIPIKK